MPLVTCKQVAKSLANKRYDDMTSYERFRLRFHVAICFVCGKFHRDVIQMQRCSAELAAREEEADGEKLSEACRERIQAAIKEEKPTDG